MSVQVGKLYGKIHDRHKYNPSFPPYLYPISESANRVVRCIAIWDGEENERLSYGVAELMRHYELVEDEDQ